MTVTARQCAAEIVGAVLDEKRPLDEALARHAGFGLLAERDRGFARLMIMTVLRRLRQIDALLLTLLEKPLTGRTQDVMHCLRLGVAQLLWLKTPPHAAVHAMVETVAEMGHERMKGLTNAVLMRVVKEGAEKLPEITNLPDWIHASWQNAYGRETAGNIAEILLAEPPLDLTVKRDAQGWAEKLGGVVLPTGSVRLLRAGRVEELPGYAEGKWWVQDAAAHLPIPLLGDVAGLEVLDLCAAPGGKTAQLLAAGAKVTAVDKSARRLALLRENLARLRLEAACVEADILGYKPAQAFDAIVLDAPCSATGTARRHPEVLWHKSPDKVAELARIQRRLLDRACAWLKPRGKLLYCVCSLEPEEGEAQAAQFSARHPEFAALPALRTHPACLASLGGMDGFFAVCWQRLNNP